MSQSTYFIDKSSNTFADNLAAFGMAFVLNGVAGERANICLENQGPFFAVVCDPPMEPEWLKGCNFFTGAPFLITFDNKTQQKVVKGTSFTVQDLPEADGDSVVDYQAERTNNEAYFAWYRSLSREDQRMAVRGELVGPPSPDIRWDIFRAVNPAALQGYNALMAEWWRGQVAFPEMLEILLKIFAQTPNDVHGAEEAWNRLCKAHGWKSKPATAIQLFNPTQGKGTNSVKTVWSSPGNLKGFWMLEWLKTVGLFHGGITRIVANPRDPRNAKDRKTYVLIPNYLEWGRHQEVMSKFRRSMVGSATAVKLDILADLRYTQAFLHHYEGARTEDPAVEIWGERPSDLVSGMQMAFYKNLGNAIATMNIAVINLPRWVTPTNPEDLSNFERALNEHILVTIGLDETRGEQYDLLVKYRDFLSANNLDPFFEFTTAYSSFIMGQFERRKPVRQFTTTTLEILFMNSDDTQKTFGQIVENQGFRNLAYAIRHSTVIPQYRKGQGNRASVDIRYGLGQQLARKAAYPAEFLAELAGFLHLYNAENAQLREKNRNPFRKDITTGDIEAVTALVDQFGSKVVCNMLVAYGYAREPREVRDLELSVEAEPEYPDSATTGFLTTDDE